MTQNTTDRTAQVLGVLVGLCVLFALLDTLERLGFAHLCLVLRVVLVRIIVRVVIRIVIRVRLFLGRGFRLGGGLLAVGSGTCFCGRLGRCGGSWCALGLGGYWRGGRSRCRSGFRRGDRLIDGRLVPVVFALFVHLELVDASNDLFDLIL